MLRTCEDGCNGCDECTDWDEPAADDDPDAPPEFGCCLPPGECCMPGLHFPSECHTAADYERAQLALAAAMPVRRPLVEIGRRATPCGECHLQPGERCDVCGASARIACSASLVAHND